MNKASGSLEKGLHAALLESSYLSIWKVGSFLGTSVKFEEAILWASA